MTPAPAWNIRGNHIRAARALLGLTQAELAERVGVSPPTISRMELWGYGHVQSPVTTMNGVRAVFLADGYELTPDGPQRVGKEAA